MSCCGKKLVWEVQIFIENERSLKVNHVGSGNVFLLSCSIDFVDKRDISDYHQEINNLNLEIWWKEDFLPCLSEK